MSEFMREYITLVEEVRSAYTALQKSATQDDLPPLALAAAAAACKIKPPEEKSTLAFVQHYLCWKYPVLETYFKSDNKQPAQERTQQDTEMHEQLDKLLRGDV